MLFGISAVLHTCWRYTKQARPGQNLIAGMWYFCFAVPLHNYICFGSERSASSACASASEHTARLLQAIPGGPKPAPGVNVILDLVGASHFSANLQSLTVEGKLLLVGVPSGVKAEIDLASVSPACILRPAGGMATECAALGAGLSRNKCVIHLCCVVHAVTCSYAKQRQG